MRAIKDAEELKRLEKAIAITIEGHAAAARTMAPGIIERQVSAAIRSAYFAAGATGLAFPSIVGSGPNGAVLHWVKNNRAVADGDLVLIDIGASFGHYAADITRTYPVGGDFGAEARAVYEIVEGARRAAVASVAPGATVASVHDAAVRALTEGLIGLGVLTGPLERALEDEAHKPFYPHQTSHWLGLDVHDVGDYALAGESRALGAGMVLTVEPGLYFGTAAQVAADEADKAAEGSTREAVARFAGIGVRIEDDVLVTPDGHEVLTAAVPTAPDEVARLIQA
jgi:Xaa-Pro aminopeptidase